MIRRKRFDLNIANKALHYVFDEDAETPKSIKEILDQDRISFGALKAYRGIQYVLSIMVILIDNVATAVNLKRNINEHSAKMAATLILSDFDHLSVEDVTLAFNNGLKSKYGPLMDRLDAQILYDWVHKYAKERAEISEARSMHEHELEKSSWNVLKSTNYKKLLKK